MQNKKIAVGNVLKKVFNTLKKFQLLYGILLVFFASFAFRNAIVERDLKKLEAAVGCDFAPFLVESAVMYSYMNAFADHKDIAGGDPALSGMENIKASEQMSLSLEYAGGWLLRMRRSFYGSDPVGEYERSYLETRFIRKAFTWYLALVPVFIFLCLYWMHLPWSFAVLGAAAQIFSAAALGRYTGQDLIKGAFALPFLSAFLACYSAALYKKVTGRKIALICAMLASAAATASWDASGMIIGLLALADAAFSIITGSASRKKRNFYLATFIAMTLTMLFVPYCRAHGTFFSPVMQIALPLAVAVNMMPCRRRRLWQIIAAVVLILWSVIAAKISPFAGNYGHFSELLDAKLKFGNVLPADPTLLTFDQRYLWTPELHSATWQITKMIFPAALPLAAAAAIIYLLLALMKRYRKKPFSLRQKFRLQQLFIPTVLTAVWFVLYIYFMRFRDMTMLFGAILLPLSIFIYLPRKKSKAAICTALAVLLLAVAVEWRTSRKIERGYPQGLNYTAQMLKYLRQHDLAGKTILCDMQTSTFLKGYTEASILIQAKYELPEVRKLTREYILTYFNEPIEKFSEFCRRNKVDYVLVHLPVITTPMNMPYSYRYMACAKNLRKDSAAYKLGLSNGIHKDFCEVYLPRHIRNISGYRIYKVITHEAIKTAEELTDQALEAYYLGKRKKARRLIRKAYLTAPGKDHMPYGEYFRITKKRPPTIKLPKRKTAKPAQ